MRVRARAHTHTHTHTYTKPTHRIMADAPPRSLLKQFQIPPVPSQYILSSMNFTISIITKIFTQIHLYTISIQGISTIFIYQMPTYTVFKKSTFYLDVKIFNS